MRIRLVIAAVIIGTGLSAFAFPQSAHAQQEFDGVYIISCNGCVPSTLLALADQSGTTFVAVIAAPGADADWEALVATINPATGQASGTLLNSLLSAIGTVSFVITGKTGSFSTSLGTAGTFERIFP